MTSDLVGRMMQHRAGTFKGHAAEHRIAGPLCYEVADMMEAAIRREKPLKR